MRLPARRTSVVAAVALGLTLGGCASSGSSGAPAAAGAVDGVRHLDVDGFAALAAAPATVLLDVRTAEEFASGHLQGARNLDFRAADFDTRLASLPKGSTYAVYCHSGNRSGQTLDRMSATGFTHVADLSGGITAWTATGRPTTTG